MNDYRKTESAYTKPSQGRPYVSIKCVPVHAVFFGVHRHIDESANVEPNFNELWVIVERLSNL
jgi:hypothetical protein